MMDVQLMRHIVDEVECGAVPEIVQTAARRWCGQEAVSELTYVRSSANHLFRFQHEGHPRYLRLAHAAERHPSAIAAELDFVDHVARTGLAVARPVASAQGRLIEDVSSRGQHYSAVVFAGLQGRQLEFDELDEAGYRAWGRALALVHRASQTFPRIPLAPTGATSCALRCGRCQPKKPPWPRSSPRDCAGSTRLPSRTGTTG